MTTDSVPIYQTVVACDSHHAFSSKERDAETGLNYFGARYYSSNLSIWLSVDPMAGSNRESVSTDEKGHIIVNNAEDVHKLPNKEARSRILNQLQNNDSKDPNSESGGCYGSIWNKEKQHYEEPCIKWGETKHHSTPCETTVMKYIQVNVPFFIVDFDFHSHGSGECTEGSFTQS